MKGTMLFSNDEALGGLLTRWELERSSGSRRFSLPLPDHVPDALQFGILLFVRVVNVLVPLLRGGLEQPAVPCIEVRQQSAGDDGDCIGSVCEPARSGDGLPKE
jgi:hypothetical protein